MWSVSCKLHIIYFRPPEPTSPRQRHGTSGGLPFEYTMTICAVCGKEHKNKLYCSKKCVGKALEKQVDRTCEICGKAFRVAMSATANGGARYCSKPCYHKARAGVAVTPQNRVYQNCEVCGKQFWVWASRRPTEGRFCSQKCANVWKRSINGKEHPLYKGPAHLVCEWCGNGYETKPAHADRSRFCSRQCHGAWTAHHQSDKRTKIELIVEGWLRKMGIAYQAQKPMGTFVCDFVIARSKLAIECDGVYWHSLPLVKGRDKRKDAWLGKNGYRVLRLREDDIYKRPKWCQEQISQHL